MILFVILPILRIMQQRLSVTVDSELISEIDKLTTNRSAAVEEGLRLWRKQQIDQQIENYYRYQSTVERRDDEEWAEFAQGQMEEILEEEGL